MKLIESAKVEDSRLLRRKLIAFNNARQQPPEAQRFRPCYDSAAGSRIRNKSSLLFVSNFQEVATIYSFVIFLQTALHVSDDTLFHHQEHTRTVITTSGTVRTVFATVRSDVEESEPKHVKMFAEI